MRAWQRENNVGFFNIEKATDSKGVNEMGVEKAELERKGTED